jgi:hypothetical protein
VAWSRDVISSLQNIGAWWDKQSQANFKF